jgi:GNAT superfamily N-acetyltransferase
VSLFLGQRVTLGPRTGAIIDITSIGSVLVHFDSGGIEDVDPNTLHYASDDYPELQDIIWERPSPEKALEGDPYLRQRSRYQPRKTAALHEAMSDYQGGHEFKFYPSKGENDGRWQPGVHTLEAWSPERAHLADPPQRENLFGDEPEPDGAIHWDRGTGEIELVHVQPHAQRQGLATELYWRAHALAEEHHLAPPSHSLQTEEGRQWARSLGEGSNDEDDWEHEGSLHIASAVTSLTPAVTGDSGQMHTDNQALPGPILSIDFIPYEPDVMCSYCNERPAECTVNGASLCLEDAEARWGIPMDQASTTPGVPGEAPQMPQEGLDDQDEDQDALEPHEAAERLGPLPPSSKPPHLQTPEEFANDPKTFWHGSPNGEIGRKVAHYGVHVGSYKAAKIALEARIGRRADGKDWDGTQEYGKTLLSNDYTTHDFDHETRVWTEHTDHHEPSYPTEGAVYSDRSRSKLTDKPALFPLRITGEMSNTPQTPHEDYKANGYMQGQLKKGVAKRGYYYRNIGEDEGSISAVLPSRDHVKTHADFIREAGMEHEAAAGHSVQIYENTKVRDLKTLHKELDQQGVPEDHPIRGVVGRYYAANVAVARRDGRITGGVAFYPNDKRTGGPHHIVQVRAMEKTQGAGRALFQAVARHALQTKRNTGLHVTGATGDGPEFYRHMGGETPSYQGKEYMPSSWTWDREATERLANSAGGGGSLEHEAMSQYQGNHFFVFHKARPAQMYPWHTMEAWEADTPRARMHPQDRENVPPEEGAPKVHAGMQWAHNSGEITMLVTRKSQRRQGLATELFNRAKDIATRRKGVIAPEHSPLRTGPGEAWAQSTGDILPPLDPNHQVTTEASLHEAMSQYQGDHFFIFHKANPKAMRASSSHLLEAWDQDHPLAHVDPDDRVKTVSQQLGRDAMGNDMSEAGMKHLVGRIGWKAKTGEISKVEVHPTVRRQGLATELLRRAKDVAAGTRGVKPPRHSPNRTNEGEAWARSLDQRLPRRDPAMVPEHIAAWHPSDADEDNLYEQGGSHHVSQGRWFRRHTSAVGDAEWHQRWTENSPAHPSPSWIMDGAHDYRRKMGLTEEYIDYPKVMADKDRHARISQAYENLPEHDERARPAFEALRNEMNHQYDHMVNHMGMKVEVTKHDPYADHKEMIDDVAKNRRMQVLGTGSTGSHPFFTNEENDRFRAVHDFFGHAATGRGFDRHGEEAAWRHHSSMFSPLARAALTTETRGQNAQLINKGQFPVQKMALLPEEFHNEEALHNFRTGAWRDVMNKAKRLRADHAVHLLEVPTPQSPYVFAEVKGDNALYHCFIGIKGDEQGEWSCSCDWGDYGPNGPLSDERAPKSPYKRRPCSHILAARWELQSRSMFGRSPYTGALHMAGYRYDPARPEEPCRLCGVEDHFPDWKGKMNGEDEVPPPVGESPIPKGAVRLYHSTWERHAPSIREHGLLQEHARGDSGAGFGNEASAGIWATTHNPLGDHEKRGPDTQGEGLTAEFFAHPHEISTRAESPWHEDPETWANDREHHVIMANDIKPRQIVALHQPWHSAYRYIKENATEARRGDIDWVKDDPSMANYARGLDKFKKEGAMGTDILDDWFAGRFLVEAKGEPKPIPEALPGMGEKYLISTQERPQGSFLTGPKGEPDTSHPLPENPEATEFGKLPKEHREAIQAHTEQWGPAHRGPLTKKRITQNFVNEYREARTNHSLVMENGKYHLKHRDTGEIYSSHRTLRGAEGSLKNLSQSQEANPERLEHTLNWYPEAHQTVHNWATTYGVDPHHMAGGVAALSPNNSWESNMATAHYMAKHLGRNTDETFQFTHSGDPALKDWDDRMSKLHGTKFHAMSDQEAAEAVSHQARFTHKLRVELGQPSKSNVRNPRTGEIQTRKGEMPLAKWAYNNGNTPNITRAVTMIRGKGEPGDVLSGHKVRSFYNNLVSPNRDRYHSATMDTHMISAGAHAKFSGSAPAGAGQSPLQKIFDPATTKTRRTHNSKGAYAHWASALRDAHRQLQSSGELEGHHDVSALQAGIWEGWRDKVNRKRTSMGEDIPYLQKMSDLKAVNDSVGHNMTTDNSDSDDSTGQATTAAMHLATGPDDTIDPYDYDDEEPDPDIFPDENAEWHKGQGHHVFAPEGDKPDDWNALDEDDEAQTDDGDGDDELPADDDYTDMYTDRRKEGAMYDWANMLRQARRQVLAEQVTAPLRVPEVPVQYLPQTLVPHHLSSGMDEFGFEHQADSAPSLQWQQQHSPGADNPGTTAPPGFGEPLDPLDRRGPFADERLLEPGGVSTDPLRSLQQSWSGTVASAQNGGGGGGSYFVQPTLHVQANQSSQPSVTAASPEAASILAEHQAGLEYLRPPSGGSGGHIGASPGMSREALLAQDQADKANLAAGAEAFLKSGSIPLPGFEVNMDTILSMPVGSLTGMGHEAKSRDFTPAEQDEMVREGELEGVRASNLGMLRLEGSMYEELERQLATDDQSEASANALWW